MAVSASQKMNCLWPLVRGGKGWVRGNLGPRYEAAIKNLIRTPMGYYPWAPSYGTTVHRLRTQSAPYDEVNTALEAELTLAFQQWIPDVLLLNARLQMDPVKQKQSIGLTWGIPTVRGGKQAFVVGPVKTTVTI